MSIAYLHIGSNIGERFPYILEAFDKIEVAIGPILESSSFYETEAWGLKNQSDFINIAIKVETYLSPTLLLQSIHKIEQSLFRKRVIEWGERTIDIDIILYDDLVIDMPDLTIPHRWMHKRNFVLIPMEELDQDLMHPIFQKSIKTLASECEDDGKVTKLEISLS